MKTLSHSCHRFLQYLLLCLLLPVAGHAQADSLLPGAGDIAGTWISSEQAPDQRRVDTLMTINPDGSFSGSLSLDSETVWVFSGAWTLDGNSVNWQYADSNLVLLQEDRSETDTILSIEQDVMTLKSGRHGNLRTLHRVE